MPKPYDFKSKVKSVLEVSTLFTLQDFLESWIFQNHWVAIILIIFLTVTLEVIVIKIWTYFWKKTLPPKKECSCSCSQKNEDNSQKSMKFAVKNCRDGHSSSGHRINISSERITSVHTSEQNEDSSEDRILSLNEIKWEDTSESDHQVSHFSKPSSGRTSSSLSLLHSKLGKCLIRHRQHPENEYETIQFSSKELFSLMKTNEKKNSRLPSDLSFLKISEFTAANEDLDVTRCPPAHLLLTKDKVRLLEENVKNQILLKPEAVLKNEATNLCSRSQESLVQNPHSVGRVMSPQARDSFPGQNANQNEEFYEAQSTSQAQQFTQNQKPANRQSDTMMSTSFSIGTEDSVQAQDVDRSQQFFKAPVTVEMKNSIKGLESDEHLHGAQYSAQFEDSSKIKYSTKGQNRVCKNAELVLLVVSPSLVAEDVSRRITSSNLNQHSLCISVPLSPTIKGLKNRRKTLDGKSNLRLKVPPLKAKKTPCSRVFQIRAHHTSKNRSKLEHKNNIEKKELHQRKGKADTALHLISSSKLITPYLKKCFRKKLIKLMPTLIKCGYFLQKQNKSPDKEKINFSGSTEQGISGIIESIKEYDKENKELNNISPNVLYQLQPFFMVNTEELKAPCLLLETRWKSKEPPKDPSELTFGLLVPKHEMPSEVTSEPVQKLVSSPQMKPNKRMEIQKDLQSAENSYLQLSKDKEILASASHRPRCSPIMKGRKASMSKVFNIPRCGGHKNLPPKTLKSQTIEFLICSGILSDRFHKTVLEDATVEKKKGLIRELPATILESLPFSRLVSPVSERERDVLKSRDKRQKMSPKHVTLKAKKAKTFNIAGCDITSHRRQLMCYSRTKMKQGKPIADIFLNTISSPVMVSLDTKVCNGIIVTDTLQKTRCNHEPQQQEQSAREERAWSAHSTDDGTKDVTHLGGRAGPLTSQLFNFKAYEMKEPHLMKSDLELKISATSKIPEVLTMAQKLQQQTCATQSGLNSILNSSPFEKLQKRIASQKGFQDSGIFSLRPSTKPRGTKQSNLTNIPLKSSGQKVDFSKKLRANQLNIYKQHQEIILKSISSCIIHQLSVEIPKEQVSSKAILSSKVSNTTVEKASNKVSITGEQRPSTNGINLQIRGRKERRQEGTHMTPPMSATQSPIDMHQIVSSLVKKVVKSIDSQGYHTLHTEKGEQQERRSQKTLPKPPSHSKADLLQINMSTQQVKLGAVKTTYWDHSTPQTREALKQVHVVGGYSQKIKKGNESQPLLISYEDFEEQISYPQNYLHRQPHLMAQTKQALSAVGTVSSRTKALDLSPKDHLRTVHQHRQEWSVPPATLRQPRKQNAMLPLESSSKTINYENLLFLKGKQASHGPQVIEPLSNGSSPKLIVGKKVDAHNEQKEAYLPRIFLHSLSGFICLLHESKRQQGGIKQRAMKDKICPPRSALTLKNKVNATDCDNSVKRLKLQWDIKEKVINMKHRKSEPGLVMTKVYEPIPSLPHFRLDKEKIDGVFSINVKRTKQHISFEEKDRARLLEMKEIMDHNITLKVEKSSLSHVLSGKELPLLLPSVKQDSKVQESKDKLGVKRTNSYTSLSLSHLKLHSRTEVGKDKPRVLRSCLLQRKLQTSPNVKRVSFAESVHQESLQNATEPKCLSQKQEKDEEKVDAKYIMDLICIFLKGKNSPFRQILRGNKPEWDNKKQAIMKKKDKSNLGVVQNKSRDCILPSPHVEWDPRIKEVYMQGVTQFCLPSLTLQELSKATCEEPTDDILSSIKRAKYMPQKDTMRTDSEEIAPSKRISLMTKQYSVSEELQMNVEEKEKKTQEDKQVDIQDKFSISFPPCSEVEARKKGEDAVQIKTSSSFLQPKPQKSEEIGKIQYKKFVSEAISYSIKNTMEHIMQREEESEKVQITITLKKNKSILQKIPLDIKQEEKKLQKIKDEPTMANTSTWVPSSHLQLDKRLEKPHYIMEVTTCSHPELLQQKSSDAVRKLSKESIEGTITTATQEVKEYMPQKEENKVKTLAKKDMLHPKDKHFEEHKTLSQGPLLTPKEVRDMDLPSNEKEETARESKEQERWDHDGQKQRKMDTQGKERKMGAQTKDRGKIDSKSQEEEKIDGEGTEQHRVVPNSKEQEKTDVDDKNQRKLDQERKEQGTMDLGDQEQEKTDGEGKEQGKVDGERKQQEEVDTKGEEQGQVDRESKEQGKADGEGKVQEKMDRKDTEQGKLDGDRKKQEKVDVKDEEQGGMEGEGKVQRKVDGERKEPEEVEGKSEEKVGVDGEGKEQGQVDGESIEQEEVDGKGGEQSQVGIERKEEEEVDRKGEEQVGVDGEGKEQGKEDEERKEEEKVTGERKDQEKMDKKGEEQVRVGGEGKEQGEVDAERTEQDKVGGKGEEQGKLDGEDKAQEKVDGERRKEVDRTGGEEGRVDGKVKEQEKVAGERKEKEKVDRKEEEEGRVDGEDEEQGKVDKEKKQQAKMDRKCEKAGRVDRERKKQGKWDQEGEVHRRVHRDKRKRGDMEEGKTRFFEKSFTQPQCIPAKSKKSLFSFILKTKKLQIKIKEQKNQRQESAAKTCHFVSSVISKEEEEEDEEKEEEKETEEEGEEGGKEEEEEEEKEKEEEEGRGKKAKGGGQRGRKIEEREEDEDQEEEEEEVGGDEEVDREEDAEGGEKEEEGEDEKEEEEEGRRKQRGGRQRGRKIEEREEDEDKEEEEEEEEEVGGDEEVDREEEDGEGGEKEEEGEEKEEEEGGRKQRRGRQRGRKIEEREEDEDQEEEEEELGGDEVVGREDEDGEGGEKEEEEGEEEKEKEEGGGKKPGRQRGRRIEEREEDEDQEEEGEEEEEVGGDEEVDREEEDGEGREKEEEEEDEKEEEEEGGRKQRGGRQRGRKIEEREEDEDKEEEEEEEVGGDKEVDREEEDGEGGEKEEEGGEKEEEGGGGKKPRGRQRGRRTEEREEDKDQKEEEEEVGGDEEEDGEGRGEGLGGRREGRRREREKGGGGEPGIIKSSLPHSALQESLSSAYSESLAGHVWNRKQYLPQKEDRVQTSGADGLMPPIGALSKAKPSEPPYMLTTKEHSTLSKRKESQRSSEGKAGQKRETTRNSNGVLAETYPSTPALHRCRFSPPEAKLPVPSDAGQLGREGADEGISSRSVISSASQHRASEEAKDRVRREATGDRMLPQRTAPRVARRRYFRTKTLLVNIKEHGKGPQQGRSEPEMVPRKTVLLPSQPPSLNRDNGASEKEATGRTQFCVQPLHSQRESDSDEKPRTKLSNRKEPTQSITEEEEKDGLAMGRKDQMLTTPVDPKVRKSQLSHTLSIKGLQRKTKELRRKMSEDKDELMTDLANTITKLCLSQLQSMELSDAGTTASSKIIDAEASNDIKELKEHMPQKEKKSREKVARLNITVDPKDVCFMTKKSPILHTHNLSDLQWKTKEQERKIQEDKSESDIMPTKTSTVRSVLLLNMNTKIKEESVPTFIKRSLSKLNFQGSSDSERSMNIKTNTSDTLTIVQNGKQCVPQNKEEYEAQREKGVMSPKHQEMKVQEHQDEPGVVLTKSTSISLPQLKLEKDTELGDKMLRRSRSALQTRSNAEETIPTESSGGDFVADVKTKDDLSQKEETDSEKTDRRGTDITLKSKKLLPSSKLCRTELHLSISRYEGKLLPSSKLYKTEMHLSISPNKGKEHEDQRKLRDITVLRKINVSELSPPDLKLDESKQIDEERLGNKTSSLLLVPLSALSDPEKTADTEAMNGHVRRENQSVSQQERRCEAAMVPLRIPVPCKEPRISPVLAILNAKEWVLNLKVLEKRIHKDKGERCVVLTRTFLSLPSMPFINLDSRNKVDKGVPAITGSSCPQQRGQLPHAQKSSHVQKTANRESVEGDGKNLVKVAKHTVPQKEAKQPGTPNFTVIAQQSAEQPQTESERDVNSQHEDIYSTESGIRSGKRLELHFTGQKSQAEKYEKEPFATFHSYPTSDEIKIEKLKKENEKIGNLKETVSPEASVSLSPPRAMFGELQVALGNSESSKGFSVSERDDHGSLEKGLEGQCLLELLQETLHQLQAFLHLSRHLAERDKMNTNTTTNVEQKKLDKDNNSIVNHEEGKLQHKSLTYFTPEEKNKLINRLESKALEIKLSPWIPEMTKNSVQKCSFYLKQATFEEYQRRLYPRLEKKNKFLLWPQSLQTYSSKEKDKLLMHFSVKTLEIKMNAFSRIVRESYVVVNAQEKTKLLPNYIHSAVKVPKQKNRILLLFDEKSLQEIDLNLQHKYLHYLLGGSAKSTFPKPNAFPKHIHDLNTTCLCKKVDDSEVNCSLSCDTELLEQHITFRKQQPIENSALSSKGLAPTPVCAFDPGLHSVVQEDTRVLSGLKPVTPEKDKQCHVSFQETNTHKPFDVNTQENATGLGDSRSRKISDDFTDTQIGTENSANVEECIAPEVDDSDESIFLEANTNLNHESQKVLYEVQNGIPSTNLFTIKDIIPYLKSFNDKDSGSHPVRACRKHTLNTILPSFESHIRKNYSSPSKTQSPDWSTSSDTLDIQSTSSSMSLSEERFSSTTSSETSYSLSSIKLHVAKNQGKSLMYPEGKEIKKPRSNLPKKKNNHWDYDSHYLQTHNKKKSTKKNKVSDYEPERSDYSCSQYKHKSTSTPHREEIHYHPEKKQNKPFIYACIITDSMDVTPKTIRWNIPTNILNFRVPQVAKISNAWNIWSLVPVKQNWHMQQDSLQPGQRRSLTKRRHSKDEPQPSEIAGFSRDLWTCLGRTDEIICTFRLWLFQTLLAQPHTVEVGKERKELPTVEHPRITPPGEEELQKAVAY